MTFGLFQSLFGRPTQRTNVVSDVHSARPALQVKASREGRCRRVESVGNKKKLFYYSFDMLYYFLTLFILSMLFLFIFRSLPLLYTLPCIIIITILTVQTGRTDAFPCRMGKLRKRLPRVTALWKNRTIRKPFVQDVICSMDVTLDSFFRLILRFFNA